MVSTRANSKTCSKCKVPKPLTEFHNDPKAADGLHSKCKRCMSLYQIRSKYGLNEKEYLAMHEKQEGKCKICKTAILLFLKGKDQRVAHVDHAHVQGFKKMNAEDKKKHVRGMLCRKCNTMIGCAKDNPETLRAAAHYLETSR